MKKLFIFPYIFILFQINVFAVQSDTLNLDAAILKSVFINEVNPALSISEISYDENEIQQVNFQDAIDFSAGLWITNSENQAQDNRMAIRGFGARSERRRPSFLRAPFPVEVSTSEGHGGRYWGSLRVPGGTGRGQGAAPIEV